jgi:hypothetical protein
MNTLILSIGVLNLFDLWATLQWIVIDAGLEANPIMKILWMYNPRFFILVKVAFVVLFCIIAYKTKSIMLMRRLIWLPFFAYICISILHLLVLT